MITARSVLTVMKILWNKYLDLSIKPLLVELNCGYALTAIIRRKDEDTR